MQERGRREEEREKRKHALASSSLLLVLLAAPLPASAQFVPFAPGAGNQSNALSQAPVPTTPQTVSGTVVDGNSGGGIFRALVRLSGGSTQRAVLTDAEGRFAFPNVDPVQVNLTVTKPGFYPWRSPSDSDSVVLAASALATPVQLHLYPEALLKGTVTGPDGGPLADLGVNAQRIVVDESGYHSVTVGATRTNVHGQFRIPVPAGNFRVETDFTRIPGLPDAEHRAVMPLVVPEPASPGESTLHLQSGEQRDLDLRPPVVSLIEVALHANLNPRELASLTAITPGGTSFSVPVSMEDSAKGGTEAIAHLPEGNFILQARQRGFDLTALSQANISVTAGHQPVPITAQFVPLSSIPIQVAIDEASLSAAGSNGQTLVAPNPRSLSLHLEPVRAEASINDEFLHPNQSRGENALSFTAPPGVYRLRSDVTRGWYIAAASYGGGDVLTNGLSIGAGSSATPLQLTVSNQVGTLRGTVTLNGAPTQCWVYLLPNSGATPIFTVRSGTDGTYNETFLPPGSYRAIAFEHRHALDPSDPNALAAYSANAASISVKVGDSATLNLEAVADSEAQP